MTDQPFTIAADANCELGENPLWNADQNCVYWTDIPAGKIYRLDVAAQKFGVIYEDEPVGGFTIQESGDLLLFRVKDIVSLSRGGKTSVVRSYSDEGMSRFNDVIADPEGRVFAGTIGKTKQSGGLYRVDLDGTITKLFEGTGCSNGMGFSPDLKTFYWTCTTTRKIFQFDYKRSSGEINNRRVFYDAVNDEGLPDGLTVDEEGFVWSARWAGSSIKRHAPDGKVIESFSFPVRNITSMCFGGRNLDQLFITSAKTSGENSPLAGALFQIPVRVKGRNAFKSKIALLAD
ncbi:MAG: SMP-30/gluconolactonase/LRE family protein [Verrucomicrobiota bacterium]